MSPLLQMSLLLLLSSSCFSRPHFPARIPNGDAWSRPDSGLQCQFLGHTRCIPGTPRNSFGLDFKDAGLQWTMTLCEKDSDGDGLTNGEELGDPCCEWTPDNPTPLRMTMLSHPGEKAMSGARLAPKCMGGAIMTPDVDPMPSILNVCGNMQRSLAVACVCFSTFRRMIRPPMRRNVLVMCKRRFGGNMKLNMLRSACNGFRDRRGSLRRGRILNNVSLLRRRCPLF